jgi:hypothetical protein
MEKYAAQALGALVQVQNLAMACVLAAFFALALRAFTLPFVDRGRHSVITAVRALSGGVFLALGASYALFTSPMLAWDLRAAIVAVAVAALILLKLAIRHVFGGRRRWAQAAGRPAKAPASARPPGLVAVLTQVCLLLLLLLVASVTLMRAGFVALTEDRIVLLLDVTGETGTQTVRWAPPDQPLREDHLTTHRVVFRTPGGERVSEAWIYGDEVAVKGRVLRLAPILNAAGVPNLFELMFAHNGYDSAERHNGQPHVAVALPPMGPLAVHPRWRRLQRWLLERWEQRASGESSWAVRSATTESTYFPLVDANGQPVRQTFRLVLTPGGLSS